MIAGYKPYCGEAIAAIRAEAERTEWPFMRPQTLEAIETVAKQCLDNPAAASLFTVDLMACFDPCLSLMLAGMFAGALLRLREETAIP